MKAYSTLSSAEWRVQRYQEDVSNDTLLEILYDFVMVDGAMARRDPSTVSRMIVRGKLYNTIIPRDHLTNMRPHDVIMIIIISRLLGEREILQRWCLGVLATRLLVGGKGKGEKPLELSGKRRVGISHVRRMR